MKTDLNFKEISTKDHLKATSTVINYALDVLRGFEANNKEKIKQFFSDRKKYYGYLELTPEQTVKELRSHLFNAHNMQKEYAMKRLSRYIVSKGESFSFQIYEDIIGQPVTEINDRIDLMRVKRIIGNLEDAHSLVEPPLPPDPLAPSKTVKEDKFANKKAEMRDYIECGINDHKKLIERYQKR